MSASASQGASQSPLLLPSASPSPDQLIQLMIAMQLYGDEGVVCEIAIVDLFQDPATGLAGLLRRTYALQLNVSAKEVLFASVKLCDGSTRVFGLDHPVNQPAALLVDRATLRRLARTLRAAAPAAGAAAALADYAEAVAAGSEEHAAAARLLAATQSTTTSQVYNFVWSKYVELVVSLSTRASSVSDLLTLLASAMEGEVDPTSGELLDPAATGRNASDLLADRSGLALAGDSFADFLGRIAALTGVNASSFALALNASRITEQPAANAPPPAAAAAPADNDMAGMAAGIAAGLIAAACCALGCFCCFKRGKRQQKQRRKLASHESDADLLALAASDPDSLTEAQLKALAMPREHPAATRRRLRVTANTQGGSPLLLPRGQSTHDMSAAAAAASPTAAAAATARPARSPAAAHGPDGRFAQENPLAASRTAAAAANANAAPRPPPPVLPRRDAGGKPPSPEKLPADAVSSSTRPATRFEAAPLPASAPSSASASASAGTGEAAAPHAASKRRIV